MDDLKNIRHFQEFKDSVNEELLWDAIKNLFSKVFGNIDKKLADKIGEFTKKLDGSKDWNESVRLFEQSTKDRQLLAAESLKTANGPLGVRKVVYDNASMVFLTLQEMSNKYQSPALAAKTIFTGKEGDMFNHDKSEEFTKNLVNACNAIMLEINNTSQAYDKAALEKYLKENIADISKVQPAPEQQTNTTGEQQTNTTGEQQTNTTGEQQTNTTNPVEPTKQNLSAEYDFKDKLFEDEAAATTPQGGVPQGDVNKLKEGTTNWLTNNLFGYSLTKLKEVKAPAAGAGGADPFDAVAKGAKGTKYPQNLAKLLRNIVNLPDADSLGRVRDAIAGVENKDKEQFKKDIGVF